MRSHTAPDCLQVYKILSYKKGKKNAGMDYSLILLHMQMNEGQCICNCAIHTSINSGHDKGERTFYFCLMHFLNKGLKLEKIDLVNINCKCFLYIILMSAFKKKKAF